MNEKKLIKIRIIAWSIVAVLLCGVLICGIKGSPMRFFTTNIFNREVSSSDLKHIKTYTFDKNENIENIKTSLNTSDLIISKNNEENIKVIVRSNKNLNDKKYIDVKLDSNTLDIKDIEQTNKKFLEIFGGYAVEVEIKLPKFYEKSLTIDNGVGDVDLDSNLNLQNLSIKVDTGDIDSTKEIKAKKINLDSNVGDAEFDYLYGKQLNLKCKIGDLKIEEFKGCGTIESKIGDIECNIEDLTGDLDIKSKTGDVNLNVNKNASFYFEGNQNFGDINTSLKFNNVSQASDFFRGEYGKNPEGKINVEVKTGDISIND